MSRYIFLFHCSLFIFLSSCEGAMDLKSVGYKNLLCDDNSKIWMINKIVVNQMNIGPNKNLDKELIIFYQSNRVLLTSLQDLAKGEGTYGEYELNSEKETLVLHLEDKSTLSYTYAKKSESDLIYLSPNSEETEYGIEIMPFPEELSN